MTIRVNGLDTEWHDADLRAAASAGPAAVVVPKVNSAAEVHNIERALELGGAPDAHEDLGDGRDAGRDAARARRSRRRPSG